MTVNSFPTLTSTGMPRRCSHGAARMKPGAPSLFRIHPKPRRQPSVGMVSSWVDAVRGCSIRAACQVGYAMELHRGRHHLTICLSKTCASSWLLELLYEKSRG